MNDRIYKIVILGAGQTGKTTLARSLAREFSTTYVPDFSREYWQKRKINQTLTPVQFVELAEEHLIEEAKREALAKHYLFIDAGVLLLALYSRFYHGNVHPQLEAMNRGAGERYHIFLVCLIEKECNAERLFEKFILDELRRREIPHVKLRGCLEERLKIASSALKEHGLVTKCK